MKLKSCAVSGNDPCGHCVGVPCEGSNRFDANKQYEVRSEIQISCG